MKTDTQHLRTVLEHFEIRNKSVAAALNVHPSLVTKWLNHERLLGINSKYLEPLADFILSRPLSPADTEWLKKQFNDFGIKEDISAISDYKRALKLWLVSDPNDNIDGLLSQNDKQAPQARIFRGNYQTVAGITDITLHLSSFFAKLPADTNVYIRIAGESVITNSAFVHAVNNAVETFELHFKILLALPYKDKQPSKTIITYLNLILQKEVEVSVVFEDVATFTEETIVIIPGHSAMLISLLPGSASPPVSLLVQEKTYVRDIEKSFIETTGRAQPLFVSPTESTQRQLQKIAKESYVKTGSLFIIRDGLNPLFLSSDGFGLFLESHGYKDDAYKWRMEEFNQRKAIMDEGLRYGLTLKELMPIAPLCDVTEKGCCTVAGEDFLETAAIRLNAKICLDLLDGYIHYLNVYPNFSIRFFYSLPEGFEDSFCLMKENECFLMRKHLKDREIHLFSQQIALLQGVANIFNDIWKNLDYAARGREATLHYLQRCVGEIEKCLS